MERNLYRDNLQPRFGGNYKQPVLKPILTSRFRIFDLFFMRSPPNSSSFILVLTVIET